MFYSATRTVQHDTKIFYDDTSAPMSKPRHNYGTVNTALNLHEPRMHNAKTLHCTHTAA